MFVVKLWFFVRGEKREGYYSQGDITKMSSHIERATKFNKAEADTLVHTLKHRNVLFNLYYWKLERIN